MILVASDFGTFLKLRSERLILSNKKAGAEDEYPLLDLEGVLVLNRGVAISSDLIFECQRRNISVTFIDRKSDIHASIDNNNGANDGTVIKGQVMAAYSSTGAALAKEIIACKLKNQRAILKFFNKSMARSTDPGRETDAILKSIKFIEHCIECASKLQTDDIDRFKKDIFIIEAHAAQKYFKSLKLLLPDELEFNARVQQNPSDQFNMGLNYCYGILKSFVSNLLNKYSIVKYVGMLHSDAPDRISFVFDVMEEFRQITCDLPLISFFRSGGWLETENNKLSLKSRRNLAGIFFEKLNNEFKYNGIDSSIGEIAETKIAEIKEYFLNGSPHRPFVLKW